MTDEKAGPHDPADAGGCAFVVEVSGSRSRPPSFCGAPRRPGSAYCAAHHLRCRLPGGSAGERQRLREIEALAEAIGGRQGRMARQPPEPLLRRLDRIARIALRP